MRILLDATDRVSPSVTAWPERLALTLGMIVVIALAVLGMWWGWRARSRRQSDLAAPQEFTGEVGTLLAVSEGRYLGTCRAGDWLDRIVAHGLGAPSAAALNVIPAGMVLTREGAPDLFIPIESVDSVRADRALAGQVLERDGVIVIRWRLGDTLVDTGFHGDRAAEHAAALAACEALLPTGDATLPSGGSTLPGGTT
jgi:hypothetical protein